MQITTRSVQLFLRISFFLKRYRHSFKSHSQPWKEATNQLIEALEQKDDDVLDSTDNVVDEILDSIVDEEANVSGDEAQEILDLIEEVEET